MENTVMDAIAASPRKIATNENKQELTIIALFALMGSVHQQLTQIADRLGRIESSMDAKSLNKKEWYSTLEVANIVGKSDFTVREWCRKRRINAKKQESGRANSKSWAISNEELVRFQSDGLLPDPDNGEGEGAKQKARDANH